MPEILKLTRAGNPILREVMPRLSEEEILSDEIQRLIENMYHTVRERKYGVGLAAPQVGARYALSVIGIKPTPNRPELDVFETVIINPEYTGVGRRSSGWEGCISIGTGRDVIFAKVPRYRKIDAKWADETGKSHQEVLGGFVAHVFQHETDHLNGVLFIDKVKDTTSIMMADEYRKRVVKGR
ncbi:peptide deformylase [Candidatus Saccharibacteria bacterium]|nr:peptide deformylase [Candidatus Saccharibacteria bacterium]